MFCSGVVLVIEPLCQKGILYANYSRYFGKDDAPVLVWQGTTEEMNSSLVGDPLIAEMYAEDQERALAEFGAQFRSDMVAFITREAVEDAVAHGALVQIAGAGKRPVLYCRGRCQSNGGSSTRRAHALFQMTIYAARARHSANAAERLCL